MGGKRDLVSSVSPVKSSSADPSQRQAWATEPKSAATKKRVTKLQLVGAAYNWSVWLFVTCLVLSQLMGVFSSSMTTFKHAYYGKSPFRGLYVVPGDSDDPYSDRSIVCVRQGRNYVPISVNDVLNFGSTKVVNTPEAARDGYRLVKRDGAVLNDEAVNTYTNMCNEISNTLDVVLNTCTRLGYNVTRSDLNIVDDVQSNTMYHIQQALPVVIMPYWDNCLDARSVIPGVDGSACMFRLAGRYTNPLSPTLLFVAVNRTVREAKTVEWLQRPGGRWSNGWYEDPSGEKWYSDVISTDPGYGVLRQQFDMGTGEEIDCSDGEKCAMILTTGAGSKFHTTTTELSLTSVTVMNGARYGLFLYEAFQRNKVESEYGWETLLSNLVIARVLSLWVVAMFALARGYYTGASDWHSAGLGCLANSQSFQLLPLLLLPRLRMVLLAMYTAGCEFEGQQRHLSEAWFVIYPSIVEFMFFYYSLLNFAAKICGRRISDVLFGPTVILLCFMHRVRVQVGATNWFGFDGRITSVLSIEDIDGLTLTDLLTSSVALRASGGVTSLLYIKLTILALNLVPLLFSRRRPSTWTQSSAETTLAVHLVNDGGVGRRTSWKRRVAQDSGSTKLNGYDLVRLGYTVYGDRYLITFQDWELLTLVTPLRAFTHLWNYRVAVFNLETQENGTISLADQPEFCHVDDPSQQSVFFREAASHASDRSIAASQA
ncbi:hypothetical protein Gpo141_00013960, partial [Globisporangium polare]